jgi:hypothetical protein
MSGYLDWAVVHASVWNQDPDEAERAHRRAIDRLGELANDDTGVIFYAESASALAVMGSHDLAQQCLNQAIKLSSPDHMEVQVAAIVVGARHGDAQLVPAMVKALTESGNFPHERLWRVELEQAIANRRLGESDAKFNAELGNIKAKSAELRLGPLLEALTPKHQ